MLKQREDRSVPLKSISDTSSSLELETLEGMHDGDDDDDDDNVDVNAPPKHYSNDSRSKSNTLQIPIAVVLYNLTQVGLMLASKALLARFSVSIAFTIYFVQCACSVTVLSAFERFKWIGIRPLPPHMLRYMFPVVCAAILTEWTFQTSVASAVSQLRVVAIFLGSVLWGIFLRKDVNRSLVNRRVIGACLVMVAATLVAVVTDPSFSLEGYTWGFASVIFGAIHTVLASYVMEKAGIKPLSTVFYTDLLSMAVLPIAMIFLGEIPLLTENWTVLSSVQFQSYIVGTSVLRFAAALSSVWILFVASPVAHSLVVSIARVPISLLSIQLFNSPTHNGGVVSVMMALAGGLYYSWTTRNDHTHIHL